MREGGKKEGREGGKKEGREGGMEGGREGGREAGREGGREGGRPNCFVQYSHHVLRICIGLCPHLIVPHVQCSKGREQNFQFGNF